MAKTNHLIILKKTQCFTCSMSFSKTHYLPSVCTATSARRRSDTIYHNNGGSLDADTNSLWIRSGHTQPFHLPPQASAHPRPQTRNHQPEWTELAQQAMAHQQAPRPAPTPPQTASPPRVTPKHCLQPRRQLSTQQRPSPHNPALKHWRHRQQPTKNWMTAPSQTKQQSSTNSNQLWINRPHKQIKVGKTADTNAECHWPHEHICGWELLSAANPSSSSRLHYWKQLKEQERHCVHWIDTAGQSEYGYCGNRY